MVRPQPEPGTRTVAKTDPPQSLADEGLRLGDLRVFHDLGRAITSALDRDSIIRAVMAQMEVFFRPKSWSLLISDDAAKTLTYAVREGRACAPDAFTAVPVGQGMAGWVAASGEPLIVPDIAAFALPMVKGALPVSCYPPELATLGFKIESAISMPLRSRNRTLGVLQLLNYRLETLTDYAMTFLNILADYAGIALENAQVIQRIQELTITDDSTQLFNSRHLHAALQTEFERARRFRAEFSLIFIDLDHFKEVNDRHGHLIGTELLAEVAKVVQHTTRAVDSVFRYGGDEFVVLLPQTSKVAAIEVAQRLRQTLRTTVFLQSRGLNTRITASFGVSTFPQDGSDVAAVLQAADTTMYSVKKSTRDNVASAE